MATDGTFVQVCSCVSSFWDSIETIIYGQTLDAELLSVNGLIAAHSSLVFLTSFALNCLTIGNTVSNLKIHVHRQVSPESRLMHTFKNSCTSTSVSRVQIDAYF